MSFRFGFGLIELWRETLADLSQNRLRSFLTMMGIAWGVASLVILTGLGEGMRKGQVDKNRLLGQNIMIMWSGSTSIPGPGLAAGRRTTLTLEDYEALRDQAYWIGKVSPEINREMGCASSLNRGRFDVHGILGEYQEIRTLEVGQGRRLDAADMDGARRVCLIGSDVNKQLFNGKARSGDEIRVNGVTYRVVGTLVLKDQNSNYNGPDNLKIFIPYPAMRRDFPLEKSRMGDRELSQIIAQPISLEISEAAEFQARQVLGARKGFDPRDEDALPIWNTATNARMMASMFDAMRLFMGFVAVVTLLLGGIGVMNIMLVAVRDRTREIGLRKAVGATRGSIMALFFFQALLISLGSGLLGYFGSLGFCAALNSLPMPDFFAGMIVDRGLGLTALGFLTFVSLAAAFYPSWTAAHLDPVDALRFEE